jgi:hypothetical protein
LPFESPKRRSDTISKLSKISYYFKKIQNDKIFKNLRAVCNKTITTLELDQYEVLWSRVPEVLLILSRYDFFIYHYYIAL